MWSPTKLRNCVGAIEAIFVPHSEAMDALGNAVYSDCICTAVYCVAKTCRHADGWNIGRGGAPKLHMWSERPSPLFRRITSAILTSPQTRPSTLRQQPHSEIIPRIPLYPTICLQQCHKSDPSTAASSASSPHCHPPHPPPARPQLPQDSGPRHTRSYPLPPKSNAAYGNLFQTPRLRTPPARYSKRSNSCSTCRHRECTRP